MATPSLPTGQTVQEKCCASLPTRQLNALRLLLEKSVFTPEEVAALDYRHVLKSPGVGQKGAGIIQEWLHAYGLELANQPQASPYEKEKVEPKRVLQAIRLLEKHGYEVHRADNA